MARKRMLAIAAITSTLSVLIGTAVLAQDKYSLKTSSGVAFVDFRGYEDWQVVSSARTDDVLKVIVANPTMIAAFKAGIPGNGKAFPEGSKIAKLQWKPKKSTEAPFVVDVPDSFSQAFFMTESEVLALDRAADVPNCGVTLYEFDPSAGRHGKLVLRFANFLAPLEQEGTPVTRAPDVPAAPKS